MSKALTIESYEDELKPLIMKPTDSEFKRKMPISLNTETDIVSERFGWALIEELQALQTLSEVLSTRARYLEAMRVSALIHDLVKPVWTPMSGTLVLPGIIKEKPQFGVSPIGISIKKEEMIIDPEKLERNIFYLFSFKDEKYVARKIEGDVLEIYEVIE